MAFSSSGRLERGWPWLLAILALEAAAGAVPLLRIGSSLLAGGLALLVVLWLGLALAAWRKPAWFEPAARRDGFLLLALLVAVGVQLLLAVVWGLARHGEVSRLAAYIQYLTPVLNVFSLNGLSLFAWLAALRRVELEAAGPVGRSLLRKAGLLWLILGALALLVSLTRIGVTRETVGSWGFPAVPLLEWQIGLSWLLGSLFMLARGAFRPFLALKHLDVWIGLAIWLGTAALWLSQPVNPAYFATPPRPPNYEIYPYSDGLTYAQYAQSILIGNGMMGDEIPQRPLYIVFLAGLMALAGQDYNRVIALQTLVLACFPLILYLIGTELGSRPLGFVAALLAALRDLTSNTAAPFSDNITYSKLFFSELPTALLLALFTLLVMRWIKRPGEARLLPLLAGGALGLAMLVRTQSAIALPIALLLAWFVLRQQPRRWLGGSTLLLVGMLLTITPWLWRNARITGGLLFDNPASQTMVLAQRYSGRNFDAVIPYLPGETDSQYSARMLKIALDGVVASPGPALGSVANHFLNNQIDNLLLLPLRSDLESLAELWRPTRAFWQDWNGSPTPAQTSVLLLYLGVLGLGIAACWQKAGWAGLMPLGLNLSYNLWTAVFRSSGERFLVPVDWAAILYYAAGLLALSQGLLWLFRATRPYLAASRAQPVPTAPGRPASWVHLGLVGLACLVVGASLPLSGWIVPQRYPSKASPERLLPELASVDARSVFQALAESRNTLVLQGRAVYPRYYAAGEREPKSAKTGYGSMDQPRLVFFLVGQQNSLVVFDLSQPPDFFPNAADVILIGQPDKGFIRAQVVKVKTARQSEVYSNLGSGK
jgi:Dolichyl-phosphate-mannose-protein mannosyltransferase